MPKYMKSINCYEILDETQILTGCFENNLQLVLVIYLIYEF